MLLLIPVQSWSELRWVLPRYGPDSLQVHSRQLEDGGGDEACLGDQVSKPGRRSAGIKALGGIALF